MNILRFMLIAFMLLGLSSASAQSNKIVFGPLEGDDAGVLTVRNGEAIEIELWVRTDPDNPTSVWTVAHGLMSEDVIIAERNGMRIEAPNYEWTSVISKGAPLRLTSPGIYIQVSGSKYSPQ